VANIGFELLAAEKKQFDSNATIWKGSTEERTNENFQIATDMAWYTFEQNAYDEKNQKISRQIFRNPNTTKAKWRVEDCLFRVSLLPGASCPQITALYISPANGIFGR
jgi:hypothetical protein